MNFQIVAQLHYLLAWEQYSLRRHLEQAGPANEYHVISKRLLWYSRQLRPCNAFQSRVPWLLSFYPNICQGLSKGESFPCSLISVNMWTKAFAFPITNKCITVFMNSQEFLFEKENAIKSGLESLICEVPDIHQCISCSQLTCVCYSTYQKIKAYPGDVAVWIPIKDQFLLGFLFTKDSGIKIYFLLQ